MRALSILGAAVAAALPYVAAAQASLKAVPEPVRPGPWIDPPPHHGDGPGFDLDWHSIDGGGATYLVGGFFELGATAGQPDAGTMAGGGYSLTGGFWAGVDTPPVCYANCDGSTIPPVLNVNDFLCFQIRYAAGDPYANCDGSTIVPVLNVNDFICFQIQYSAGCP